MRIAINALSQIGAGTRNYLNHFLPALGTVDQSNEYIIFLPAIDNQFVKSEELGDNFQMRFVEMKRTQARKRLLYEQCVLPFVLKQLSVDVLYSPSDISACFALCPTVLAIQNLLPFSLGPSSSHISTSTTRHRLKKLVISFCARKASKVTFISHYSCAEISQQIGLCEEKLSVVYPGMDMETLERPTFDTQNSSWYKRIDELKSYILNVSTIYPHKNLEILIKAYAELPKDLGGRYHLVLAGENKSPRYYAQLQNLVCSLGLRDRAVFLGRVPPPVIPYLYDQASIFVLPSLIETFGYPLVEAMACGTPVVAADSSSIPEIVDKAGILFRPNDVDDLAGKIELVLRDSHVRSKLIAVGKQRAQDFSWRKSAQETLETLKQAAVSGS